MSKAVFNNSYLNLEKTREFLEEKLDPSITNRVLIASLPFFGLYAPFGKAIFVVKTGIRVFSYSEEYQNTESLFFKRWIFTKGCVATMTIGNLFFNSKKAMVVSSVSDILESLNDIVYKQGLSEKSLSFLNVMNSTASIGLLLCPSLEVLFLSLSMQIIFELAHALNEGQKESRGIEMAARLLMTGIKGRQALPLANVFWKKHGETITLQMDKGREKVAAFFHRLDSLIASPFWWYTEKFIRITRPIQLGVNGQCSNYRAEIVTRAFYGAIGVPMALYVVPASIIELVPRTLAKIIAPKPFFYLEGNVKEKSWSGKQLNILTMNVCFVAGGFAELFAGGIGNWQTRIDPLVENILNQDPDVICLQEVNDVNAGYALHEKLKNNYAHFYHNVGATVLSQNSGHFVASKYAINDPMFIPFNTGEGLQAMVNKGLFNFTISRDSEVLANITAVHLSPSEEDLNATSEEGAARSIELEICIENIRKKALEHVHAFKVFLGDFNLPFTSREYEDSSINSLEFVDPLKEGNSSISLEEGTCGTDQMKSAYKMGKDVWFEKSVIIDYTLLWNDFYAKTAKIFSCSLKGFDSNKAPHKALSDHNGIILTLEKRG